MILSHVVIAGIAVAMTSCAVTGVEMHLEPRTGAEASTTQALMYLSRAVTRYRMVPVSQSDLACRQAWRVDGKPRGHVLRAPVLVLCSDYQPSGAIDVRLYYDGSWKDSTLIAGRIRRELTDSLALFGALTVRDSAPSLLTRR